MRTVGIGNLVKVRPQASYAVERHRQDGISARSNLAAGRLNLNRYNRRIFL
jgi:fibronectin type 3 domain-containing protein